MRYPNGIRTRPFFGSPFRVPFSGPLFGSPFRVDIALDPLTYTGETTTCDSLWMGVPVVTLAGDTMASRRGATIMNNMGMREWIAKRMEEYVRIAARHAFDLDALEESRANLRQRMSQSPITDGPRYTRALEEAYRFIWRRWCNED